MNSFFDIIIQFVSNPALILSEFIKNYDNLIYLFLFVIIFAETGLIIFSFLMPFLPGDALLFAVGIICANKDLNIYLILPTLIFAALLGDNINYFIGKRFGSWLLKQEKTWFLKKKHIEKAEVFFQKHGKKSIIIARFIPVIRTIVPFLSGATNIKYKTFLIYSFLGAFLWVGVMIILGFTLGQFDFVKNHIEKVIFFIILIANIPLIKQLFNKKNE